MYLSVKVRSSACLINALICCRPQGGFIFPLFFAGAALGRALLSVADDVLPPDGFAASPVLLCMCFAAGLNVAVTRTPFASPLILATLSGQPNIMAPALCAALTSLFITRSSKFIGPQQDRADLHFFGDLQPLEEPSLRYSPPLSAAAVAQAARNGNVNGGARDEETGSLLATGGRTGDYNRQFSIQSMLAGVEAPLPDCSVRSEGSNSGAKEPAAPHVEEEEEEEEEEEDEFADEDSPITASYRQGELIKLMVSDADFAAPLPNTPVSSFSAGKTLAFGLHAWFPEHRMAVWIAPTTGRSWLQCLLCLI